MHHQGNTKGEGFQRYTEAMQQQQAAKGQLLFHQEETVISHLQPQHEEHHGGGIRGGTTELLLWGEIWGHKQAKASSTESDMAEHPICHADQGPTRVPPGSHQGPIRLCEQAFGTTGTVERRTGQ